MVIINDIGFFFIYVVTNEIYFLRNSSSTILESLTKLETGKDRTLDNGLGPSNTNYSNCN